GWHPCDVGSDAAHRPPACDIHGPRPQPSVRRADGPHQRLSQGGLDDRTGRAGIRARVSLSGAAATMRWLDCAGPPGSGKSTLCDYFWDPHSIPIEDRLPPASWHDFLNEVSRLFWLFR